MTEQTDAAAVGNRTRLKLALIFLMPLIMISLATLAYYTGIGIPRATSNKGVLVVPPRQVDALDLRDAAGASWRWEASDGGWGIVYVGGSVCGTECKERLTLGRQVHKSIGREQERVHRYYLMAGESPDPATAAWLSEEHPGLRILRASEADLRALLGRDGDPDPFAAQPLYLVDPRGFAMMHYLPAHPGRAMLDDLRFLLKNSPR